MQQFIEGDSFLMLRAELNASQNIIISRWTEWSLLYLDKTPKYLIKAYKVKYAEKLLKPLNMSSIERFRSRMVEITPNLIEGSSRSRSLFLFRNHPLGDFDPQMIGSQV